MTDLETAMATIIAVFQKYSEREGDKHKLKKSELKDLLHDELPDLMAVRQTELADKTLSMTMFSGALRSFAAHFRSIKI